MHERRIRTHIRRLGDGHMTDLLAADAVFADAATVIRDGGIVIRDGVIIDTGPADELASRHGLDPRRLPGVLMPGMVDAHSHLRGTPLRSHGVAPRPLPEWICTLTAMTPLPPRDETLIASAGLLRTGVTSVQAFAHSHAGQADYAKEVREISEGAAATGIRLLLAVGLTDIAEFAPEPRPVSAANLPRAQRSLAPIDYSRLIEILREEPLAANVALAVGPVGPQWCTDEALQAVSSARSGLRVHTHLHEHMAQRTWLADKPDPLTRLTALGLVDSGFTGAHGIHLTAEELAQLGAARASLVHCPISNVLLEVGTAPVRAWLDAGVTAALGIDSADDGNPDMFAVMREAMHVAAQIGAPLEYEEVVTMATTGGAIAVGDAYGGALRPGLRADVVHVAVAARSARQLVEMGSAQGVQNVWAAGSRVIVDGMTRTTPDETAARARIAALLDADAAARSSRYAEVERALAPTTLTSG